MILQLLRAFLEAATSFFTWRAEESRLAKERLQYDIEKAIENDIDVLEGKIESLRMSGHNELADRMRQRQARRVAYLSSIVPDIKAWG